MTPLDVKRGRAWENATLVPIPAERERVGDRKPHKQMKKKENLVTLEAKFDMKFNQIEKISHTGRE